MGVLQYRVGWNTGGTNPGVSVFHARIGGGNTAGGASQDFADRTRTFFDAVKGFVAGAIVWDFPGEVLELDTASGDLEGVHEVTKPTNVTASGTGNWAAPAGARIEWRTTAIVSGRRLRGRTFLVPLVVSAYDAAGSLTTPAITALTAAANAYKDANVFVRCNPCVYSRTHGIQADISSVLLPDEVSILRSRRE